MSNSVPDHSQNLETFALGEFQCFDAEVSASTPGQRARVRPAERPRPVSEDIPQEFLQILDHQASPAPSGTKAKPRPKGRERKTEAIPRPPQQNTSSESKSEE